MQCDMFRWQSTMRLKENKFQDTILGEERNLIN